MTGTHKKVDLLNVEIGYGLTIESDGIHHTLCIVEYEVDEEKSTHNHEYHKPSSTTEIYIGDEELHEIINALMYIKDEE